MTHLYVATLHSCTCVVIFSLIKNSVNKTRAFSYGRCPVMGALFCLCCVKKDIQSSLAFSHSGVFSFFFSFLFFQLHILCCRAMSLSSFALFLLQLPAVTMSAPHFSANLCRVSYSSRFRKNSRVFFSTTITVSFLFTFDMLTR